MSHTPLKLTLVLCSTTLLSACIDLTSLNHSNPCETEYYSELLGEYQGRITADLYDNKEHDTHLNQCVWDVKLNITSEEQNTGHQYCSSIGATFESSFISQNNLDGGEHTCIDVNDTVYVSDKYSHDFLFHEAPEYPVLFNLSSFEDAHPETEDIGRYISPVTGSFHLLKSSHSYIIKEDDGTISLRRWPEVGFDYQDESTLPLEEWRKLFDGASLSGVLVKQ